MGFSLDLDLGLGFILDASNYQKKKKKKKKRNTRAAQVTQAKITLMLSRAIYYKINIEKSEDLTYLTEKLQK